MMYLYSATPGTGKTCWVVKQLVDNWIEDPANENRKIYSNIAGLKIEGILEAPEDFRECEDGAIIIYDEAQEIDHYSSDSRGQNPIAKALSKHRHRGFDIHFISQDPSLLHKYVLKNIYLHYYLWRPAQRKNIEIFTFARAIVTPTSTDFKNAYDKKWWRFETHYLQYYKSTVMNTSKKVGSSRKINTIFTFILFMCAIGYFIYPVTGIDKKMSGKEKEPKQQQVEQAVPIEPQQLQQIEQRQTKPSIQLNQQPVLPGSEQIQQTVSVDIPKKEEPDYFEMEKNRPTTIMISGDKCTAMNRYQHYLDLSLAECKELMKRPLEGSYLPLQRNNEQIGANYNYQMATLDKSQIDEMTNQIKPPVYN